MTIEARAKIFKELERLTQSDGYIHALLHLYVNNYVQFYNDDGERPKQKYKPPTERVISTEFQMLLGLMVKAEIDFSLPPVEQIQKYMNKTQILLNQLHEAFIAEMVQHLFANLGKKVSSREFWKGSNMAETIFYGDQLCLFSAIS